MNKGSPTVQAVRVRRSSGIRRSVGPLVLAMVLLGGLVTATGPHAADGVGQDASAASDATLAPAVKPFPSATPTAVATPLPRRPVVALDPGHGGPDDDLPRADRAGRIIPWYREGDNSGAIHRANDGTELREKDLTLRIALAAAELLEARDVMVMLTRRADLPVNLEKRDYNGDGSADLADELLARVDLVNRGGADLLVSIHFNAHPSASMRGSYAAYASGRPFTDESVRLAQAVHARVLGGLAELHQRPVDRGVEDDAEHDGSGRHLVLFGPRTAHQPLETTMPGTLVEPLFLTNPDDVELLRRADVLDMLARSIAEGILDYLGRA
jgi:N-acetylmuramoyl-L-alanine amidase